MTAVLGQRHPGEPDPSRHVQSEPESQRLGHGRQVVDAHVSVGEQGRHLAAVSPGRHTADVGRPDRWHLAPLEIPELIARRAGFDVEEPAARNKPGSEPSRWPIGDQDSDVGPIRQSMNVE